MLFTPPFTLFRAARRTRDMLIIKLAKELGIEVREQVLSVNRCIWPTKCYVRNRGEITPVRSVDGIG